MSVPLQICNSTDIRAPTVDVGYVPNAKYLAHIPHQTQKSTPIRHGICAKIIPLMSVPLQICNDTDICGISK